MGSIAYNCNTSGILVQPAKVTCPQKFGQIVKMFFRIVPTSATPNTLTPTNILTQATWQALIDETDASKIIVSEPIGSFTLPTVEPVIVGDNSNEMPFGLGEITGFNSQQVAPFFINMPTEIAEQYRGLTPYSTTGQLEAFFITELGQIIADTKGGNPTGIRIRNFTVGSVTSEGINAPNKHPFFFYLEGQWDKNVKVYTPVTFNPLDLVGTVAVS